MKKERKTRKEKAFTKTFGWLLCSVIMMGFIGQVGVAEIPPLKWPLEGTFGDRMPPILDFGANWVWGECPAGVVKKHVGIDVSATVGENVYAPEAGIVKAKVYQGDWKYCITIEHSGFTTVCWHIDPLVDVEDNVARGQIIGTIADITPDPDHLHFGVRDSSYSNISNRGALPQNDCDGDPGFPEYFVDPKTLNYGAIYVPDDYSTIQAAINNCNNGDTIIVRNGTYTGTGNRDIDFKGKAITLRSQNGPGNCILNCQGTAANPHRAFYFHSGEEANSVVDGFTITNGSAKEGGGIHCTSSSPTITNCLISGNFALGIYPRGGGVYCSESAPMITGCTISNNSADGGGGVYCVDSNPAINNSVIRNNYGGGVCFWESSSMINACTISNNSSDYGGGIYFYTEGSHNLTIANCIISGNSALGGGGVKCFTSWSQTLRIINSTIVDNLATNYGGGVYCESSSLIIGNSILCANSPDQIDTFYSTATVTYSDIQEGWEGQGNINLTPLFVNPDNDDYHLKSQAGRWDPNSQSWVCDEVTSRCIDAGNPGSPLGNEPVSVNNTRINMGAYGGTDQASKSPANWSLSGDLTNDGVVQFDDLFYQIADWLFVADQQSGDLNRDGRVDLADFALFANGWLSQTNWYQP